MASFQYQAIDADGQPVAGVLAADSVQQAVAALEARGLTVHTITLAAAPGPRAAADASSSPRGSDVEQAVLRTHMATILERGRAILPALRAYSDEMPAGWQRRQLRTVCRVLERGDAAEAAAALVTLPECWIPLLSAATSSPDPGHVLREFLTESERTEDLRQQWWRTLAYPLLVVCLATAVMTAISILIIPEFREIFDEFDLQLPGLTKWLLTVAGWLSSWGLLMIAALLILFVLFLLNSRRLLPSPAFAWLGDRFRPTFGRRTAVARFTRFTADLLDAGVTMPDALRIAGFTTSRSGLQRAAWRLAGDLEAGTQVAQRSYQRPLTATVLRAITADMPTASRIRLLREISSCHAERVRVGLSWTSGIIEPMAIVLVGVVVGATVFALFIPLVKLVEGLSK